MKKTSKLFTARRLFVLLAVIVIGVVIVGCFTCILSTPRLSPEDRRADIEYLAHWARTYSPFVELNERHKGLPSYEELKAEYVELAERAEDNAEFARIAYSYASLIGASGHFYIFNESGSNWFFESRPEYWHRIFHQHGIVHPPFWLERRGNEYVTLTEYEYEGARIPIGSRILAVEGMNCQAFLQYLKRSTWVSIVPVGTGTLDRKLLLIKESKHFKGWKVDFLRPDQSVTSCFVPAKEGPSPFKSEFVDTSHGNCVCLVLGESVGYIRVKTVAPEHVGADREKIHLFLARSEGSFSRLIIDVRSNPGGCTEYVYQNLIKPFLDRPVSYKQITGLKRRFLDDHSEEYIDGIRFTVSKYANETSIVEVPAPPEFNGREWVFYEISRELKPQNCYPFEGDIFILINGSSGSGADDFANAVKRIGIATLVGQNTYGSAAAYVGPVILRLPESGMEFRLEADLLVNPDGTYNEIVGTPPDIWLPAAELPKTVTKEAMLKDDWIRKIISDL